MSTYLKQNLIEKASFFDKKEILSIYKEYFSRGKEYSKSLAERIFNPDNIFLISREESGKVTGFLESSIEHACELLYINHFAVGSEYAGQGIGSLLLYEAAQKARQGNIPKIVAVPSRKLHAEGFYIHKGFKQDGIIQYSIDTEHLLKRLD